MNLKVDWKRTYEQYIKPSYLEDNINLTMTCKECGLIKKPNNWFFATEKEMIKDLAHICKTHK